MDFFTIMIIAAIVLTIIGSIIWYVFVFVIAKAALTHIARNLQEFQRMDIDGMYRTLVHLQQSGQYQIGQRYINSVEGPVTSQIRSMAASEGISLNF